MIAARRDLNISIAEIDENQVFVLELDQGIVGFYELKEQYPQEIELLWLSANDGDQYRIFNKWMINFYER